MPVPQGLKQHEVDSDDDLTRSNSVVFNAFIFMQARLSLTLLAILLCVEGLAGLVDCIVQHFLDFLLLALRIC